MSFNLPKSNEVLSFDDARIREMQCSICFKHHESMQFFCASLHTCCPECCDRLPVCALCRQPPLQTCDMGFVQARHINAAVKVISVKCENHGRGCDYQCGVFKMEKHVNDECAFALVACPAGCGVMVERGKLSEHLEHGHGGLAIKVAMDSKQDLKQALEKMTDSVCAKVQLVLNQNDNLRRLVLGLSDKMETLEQTVSQLKAQADAATKTTFDLSREVERLGTEVEWGSHVLGTNSAMNRNAVELAVANMPKPRKKARPLDAEQAAEEEAQKRRMAEKEADDDRAQWESQDPPRF